MEELSKNFNRSEFKCKGKNCCDGTAIVHPDLIKALQQLRDIVGSPIKINSGFRCNRYNKEIGGVDGSYHTLGMATDISCKYIKFEILKKLAVSIPQFREGGVGVYNGWLHLDVRKTGRARW